jgi:hypothetical protein
MSYYKDKLISKQVLAPENAGITPQSERRSLTDLETSGAVPEPFKSQSIRGDEVRGFELISFAIRYRSAEMQPHDIASRPPPIIKVTERTRRRIKYGGALIGTSARDWRSFCMLKWL